MTQSERKAVVDEDHTQLTYYGDTLAPHLTCQLCKGLLRDAYTVKECLHRFCKSCVVKWYRNASHDQMRKCPQCSVTLEDYGWVDRERGGECLQCGRDLDRGRRVTRLVAAHAVHP